MVVVGPDGTVGWNMESAVRSSQVVMLGIQGQGRVHVFHVVERCWRAGGAPPDTEGLQEAAEQAEAAAEGAQAVAAAAAGAQSAPGAKGAWAPGAREATEARRAQARAAAKRAIVGAWGKVGEDGVLPEGVGGGGVKGGDGKPLYAWLAEGADRQTTPATVEGVAAAALATLVEAEEGPGEQNVRAGNVVRREETAGMPRAYAVATTGLEPMRVRDLVECGKEVRVLWGRIDGGETTFEKACHRLTGLGWSQQIVAGAGAELWPGTPIRIEGIAEMVVDYGSVEQRAAARGLDPSNWWMIEMEIGYETSRASGRYASRLVNVFGERKSLCKALTIGMFGTQVTVRRSVRRRQEYDMWLVSGRGLGEELRDELSRRTLASRPVLSLPMDGNLAVDTSVYTYTLVAGGEMFQEACECARCHRTDMQGMVELEEGSPLLRCADVDACRGYTLQQRNEERERRFQEINRHEEERRREWERIEQLKRERETQEDEMRKRRREAAAEEMRRQRLGRTPEAEQATRQAEERALGRVMATGFGNVEQGSSEQGSSGRGGGGVRHISLLAARARQAAESQRRAESKGSGSYSGGGKSGGHRGRADNGKGAPEGREAAHGRNGAADRPRGEAQRSGTTYNRAGGKGKSAQATGASGSGSTGAPQREMSWAERDFTTSWGGKGWKGVPPSRARGGKGGTDQAWEMRGGEEQNESDGSPSQK